MISNKHLAFAAWVFLLLTATYTGAQEPASSVNPEAVEFNEPTISGQATTGYLVEFFIAGADTRRDTPVKSVDLGVDAMTKAGRIRVALQAVVLDMPDGRYIATIRTLTDTGSEQSQPSDPFILAREGSVAYRVDAAHNERFWTKVAIAIGASIILIPLLVR